MNVTTVLEEKLVLFITSVITPLVETFYDRVTFRIPSNISDGAPLQKQSTVSYKLHYNTLL